MPELIAVMSRNRPNVETGLNELSRGYSSHDPEWISRHGTVNSRVASLCPRAPACYGKQDSTEAPMRCSHPQESLSSTSNKTCPAIPTFADLCRAAYRIERRRRRRTRSAYQRDAAPPRAFLLRQHGAISCTTACWRRRHSALWRHAHAPPYACRAAITRTFVCAAVRRVA